MKKIINKCFYGEGNPNNHSSVTGISDNIVWKLTEYYGGPEKEGKYFISYGDGEVQSLYCTGSNKGIKLFDDYIEGHYSDIVWDETEESLTNDELVAMCREYNIWYDVQEDYSCGEWCGTSTLIIIGYARNGVNTMGNVPKYFLEEGLKGPMDSEVEDMEEVVIEK